MSRTLTVEPFANQIEMIDKALIDVHNQPAPYYGRRGRAQNPTQNTKSPGTGNHALYAGAQNSGQFNSRAKYYPKYGYQVPDYYRPEAEIDVYEKTHDHIPQVFEERYEEKEEPYLGFVEKKQDNLATFDPFSTENSNSVFQFNSSNLLSSNYTPTSLNIWRSNGKPMSGEAVWG